MSLGYASARYVESLREFGTPLHLPRCDGWLLERPIPGSPARDAMGCYPLFACSDWSMLAADCQALSGRLASVSLVTDPFAPLNAVDLQAAFDLVVPFKEHFAVELSPSRPPVTSKHHRYYARKALKELRVIKCVDPGPAELEQWALLYSKLVQRHRLRGIKAFSRQSFAGQMRVPGLVMLQVRRDSRVIGAHLWFVQGEVAYSHLMALDDEGYACNAAYALYWQAIHEAASMFSPHVRWLSLGGGAGVDPSATDGLARFKRGWSNATRQVYLCGKILDAPLYDRLAQVAGTPRSAYFPAYRAGEFA